MGDACQGSGFSKLDSGAFDQIFDKRITGLGTDVRNHDKMCLAQHIFDYVVPNAPKNIPKVTMEFEVLLTSHARVPIGSDSRIF